MKTKPTVTVRLVVPESVEIDDVCEVIMEIGRALKLRVNADIQWVCEDPSVLPFPPIKALRERTTTMPGAA